MKNYFAALLMMCSLGTYAQYTPQYQRTVNVTEPFGTTLTDYPALLIVDTQTPIAAGQMQASGADIRFSTDCGLTQTYDYWIESGINTTATRIWVRIPSLAANATTGLHMTYGDAAASAASSFSATFPNAVTTSGNITLTGTQQPGWLHVQTGDTLFVTTGAPLTILAGYIKIDGVIKAEGRGYTAPSTSTVGNGPGGGTFSTNSGAGGGSYAGTGGTGGYDAGDTPGNGGATYGTQTGTDIDMGSAGGSSDNHMGGNGGGAVILKASHIYVSGTINAKGADAPLPGGARGGGGGAGGGVLIMADSIVFTGTINVNGGAGGVGTSTANDSGGGGGAGRSKMFSDAGINNSGTITTNGGAGGPYGGILAQNGGTGTTHSGAWTFAQPTVNNQENLTVTYVEANNNVCVGASSFTLTSGTPSGGTYSGTGVSGNIFDPAVAGVGTHPITYSYTDALGCVYNASPSSVTVNALPTVTYIEPASPMCLDNGTIALTAGTPTGGTYSGNGVTGNSFDPMIAGIGNHSVIYSYTDGSGCMNSDTSLITVNSLPVVTYIETTTTICLENAAFTLQTGSPTGGTYTGAGVTGNMFDPATAGSGTHDIVYTFTDGSGCMNSDTSQITVENCAGINDNAAGNLNIYPNPFTNKITIKGLTHAENIVLYNMMGEIVYSSNNTGAETMVIDAEQLSNGVYFLSISMGDETMVKKVVKD